MKRLIVLILMLASIQAYSQKKIEFTEYNLDNGMHVILHQDNSTPIVAVSVFYHVGSKNEDPKRTGFAHFFEHLLFEGSENIKRGEFFNYITAAGGTNNATTDQDRTYYYEILPSNQLELGLWLESERLMHAKIEQIGVDTQREVVKEERRLRVDNQPYGRMPEELLKRAYTKHPYKWMPIGSIDHLNEATLEEFIDFYKTFYVPNNATLTIAGDLDIEKTKKMIADYFGPIPRGTKEIPRPTIVEPVQTKEVRDVAFDKVQIPMMIQAYHMPQQGSKDHYALQMLSTLLSGGQSSRLYKKLVDEEQKALQVGAIPLALEDPGLYAIIGLPNFGGDIDELEAAIDKEITQVKNELITDNELQKIRNQVENNFISGFSSVEGIAGSLAKYHVFYGDANLINTEISRFMEVTKEDIRAVAKKYLNPENRVVLQYMPESARKAVEGTSIEGKQ